MGENAGRQEAKCQTVVTQGKRVPEEVKGCSDDLFDPKRVQKAFQAENQKRASSKEASDG